MPTPCRNLPYPAAQASRQQGVGWRDLAEQQGRFLSFIDEDHIRRAIAVEIQRRGGAGVEDALIQADFLADIGEGTVAIIAKQVIGSLDAADQHISSALAR